MRTARELFVTYRPREDLPFPDDSFTTPADIVRFVLPALADEAVEVAVLMCLTAKQRLLCFHTLSRGCLGGTPVHPREVFKVAMLANAHGIVLVHNHPSGDPTPSLDDRLITERLRSAGDIVGIPLLDHIIVASGGSFFSFREFGNVR